ncbi:hypothetical protein KOI35_32515 [Actinoplanes bogorensis]|uniref:Uncharacterized protein n=1 Tax=Paractinoplanes bogorensis TaxID=1610840 RepID=A0ABS5YXT8_9ACTN|nr:hypothetical protein [Actinoplanes bogorensis]MBU2668246.1 hypothetical protein [Actinoplanes bogorensis]
MGASGWDYYVPYQPDLAAAFTSLRTKVFDDGDYFWAVHYDFGKTAADFPDRPRTMDELWSSEDVQESGTHSIVDMSRLSTTAGPGVVTPLTDAEALSIAGSSTLTRAHVERLQEAAYERWSGRCAVLHDADGKPAEIYFWGASGD